MTSTTATDAIKRLNALRLQRNWSFEQLVADMRSKGALVKKSTIFRLIHEHQAGRQPQETTLYQIRLYLERTPRSRASRSSRAQRLA